MLTAKCDLLFLDKNNKSAHKMLIICLKGSDFCTNDGFGKMLVVS